MIAFLFVALLAEHYGAVPDVAPDATNQRSAWIRLLSRSDIEVWIQGARFFDGGKNLLDGANLLVDTGIMAALAGGADNTHFINYVFHNVTGTVPDSATLASFVSLLDSHTLTQAQLLVAAAQSTQNQTHVNLAGLVQTGLLFL